MFRGAGSRWLRQGVKVVVGFRGCFFVGEVGRCGWGFGGDVWGWSAGGMGAR